jgi:hypothetical protein
MLLNHQTRQFRRIRLALATSTLALGVTLACHPPVKSTLPGPPTAAQLAELWVEPPANRDLYWGVGGKELAPDPDAKYTVTEVKTAGFSRGYDLIDDKAREWSAKFPPEALTEVVASRIHWGIGYHQPPIYYVTKWNAEKAPGNPQLPARFREKDPDLHGGLEADGSWSYYQNPFVDTVQMRGLIVLQAMLGNSDLKDEQNVLYKLKERAEGATIWYVARDLGHTFGHTGLIDAPRGDIEAFESTPFIRGVANGRVKLEWDGRHGALLENITPADVRWICGRLAKLTNRQWEDAFRAGGYDKELTGRFIHRLKQKIAEGLALKG